MLDKYLDNQEIVTSLLLRSLNTKKLVQAYLFVCDDVDYIYEYAKTFTKEIIKLSGLPDEKLENIYKRIDKNEYTELKLVEPSGLFIKKEQLLDLQNSVLNKPVEANKIVYIIKNCEKLNSSSANSILKFLEEPSDDIIAILLTDNINMVMPTIKSRCQVLNFKNVKNSVNTNNLERFIMSESSEKTTEELDNLFLSTIEVIKNIEKNSLNTYIYSKTLFWDKFKDNEELLILLNTLTYFYVDAMRVKLNRSIKYCFEYNDIINLIVENNDINDIISKVNKIEELKNHLKMNVNSKLLIDKLIIELSEV